MQFEMKKKSDSWKRYAFSVSNSWFHCYQNTFTRWFERIDFWNVPPWRHSTCLLGTLLIWFYFHLLRLLPGVRSLCCDGKQVNSTYLKDYLKHTKGSLKKDLLLHSFGIFRIDLTDLEQQQKLVTYKHGIHSDCWNIFFIPNYLSLFKF